MRWQSMALVGVWAVGCTSNGNGDGGTSTRTDSGPPVAEITIGSRGGVIQVPGVRVTVPAGALSADTVLTLRTSPEAIPAGLSVVNAHEVAPILQNSKVKLVLAGHLHICETFVYKGIEYSNVGAVCGNWWRGPREGFEEGYARLEFRGDQVSWEYIDYGWEAQAAPATPTAA